MRLTPYQIAHLENFLQTTRDYIYPEPPSPEPTQLAYKLFNYCLNKIDLPPQAKILDVGCGQGIALELFKEKGFFPWGLPWVKKTSMLAGQRDMRFTKWINLF